MEGCGQKTFVAFLVGSAMGAAAGLLLVPLSGRDLRGRASKRVRERVDDGRRAALRGLESGERLVARGHDALNRTSELLERLREATEVAARKETHEAEA